MSAAGMPRSLFEVLAQRADKSAHAVAALDDIQRGQSGRLPARLTYKELHSSAVLLAGAINSCLEAEAETGGAVIATRMRRGNEWYAVFFAATKLQVPLVALSVDLPDKAAENSRNAEILAEHKPFLLVTDDTDVDGTPTELGCSATKTLSISELWALAEQCAACAPVPGDPEAAPPPCTGTGAAAPSPDATLCFCYTGGTTEASRSVRVTHRMALFEVASYPRVAKLAPADRVLQQHSLYWGASAYGEVDIALAFGCTLVFCEAWDIDGVAAAIVANKATCAGLVPSILSSLDPQELPSLRLVFTWGEALQAKVAREWAKRTHLVDLLISTECWLSLYADWTEHARHASVEDSNLGSPEFRVVPGTEVRIRTLEDGGPADGAGELLVAGPMVMPGYTDPKRNAAVLAEDGGTRWYCTRDCVAPRGRGFVFAGRADDLVKVGGVWVDVREVERELAALSGVKEVRILQRTAFVALGFLPEGTVPQLRRALPPDFALFIVQALPRRAGTDKVDRRRLMELVGHSLAEDLQGREDARCEQELEQLSRWFRMLLFLVLTCLLRAGILQLRAAPGAREVAAGGVLPTLVVSLELVLLALFAAIRELAWRFCCLAYLQLIFFTNRWPKFCKRANNVCHYVPFGLQGALIFLVCALPGPVGGVVIASPGMYQAWQRGRLLSWPLVCLAGFPVWARESGIWWTEKGVYGVLVWYTRRLRALGPACCQLPAALGSALARPVASACTEVSWRVALRRGTAMKCHECKKNHASSGGHVDPEVDPFWYCNACWSHYHKHQLCASCKTWRTRGRVNPDTGKWMCFECRHSKTTPSPLQGAAAAAAVVDGTGTLQDLKEPLLGNGATSSASGPAEGPRAPDVSCVKNDGHAANGTNGTSSNNGLVTWVRPTVQKRVLELDLPESFHQLEHIDASSQIKRLRLEGLSTPDGHPCGADPEACPQPPEPKPAEWLLVEKATGWTFSSSGDSLASLDSLRTAKISSALLREAGVRLPRQALRQCKTLAELLAEIAQAQERLCERAERLEAPDEEHKIWGLMWNSKCQWTLRRDRPLQEEVLRAALQKLVDRHPGLRTRLADPMRMFTVTQQAFSVFEMWRKRRQRRQGLEPAAPQGPLQRLAARLAGCALGAVQWSFRRAWPRIAAAQSRSLPLHVMPHSADLEGAKRALWGTPAFVPPLQISFAPFDKGALVSISVTHMTSDGYCLMPLLADLAHFVAQEEAIAGGGAPPAPLPALPSAFAVTESRITRTIDGSVSNDAPTLDPISMGRNWSKESITVLTIIPAEVVAGIRRAARVLAVSDDIVMLAAVSATLARFQKTWVAPITMVVPQRDGPGESDMVGLFADMRIISVPTKGFSLAGLVMWLHHIVKERLWRPPPVESQYEVPFVNFEWTDFDSRQGFTQFVQCREGPENVQNTLKVAVDQPDRFSWRMRVVFDANKCDQDRRDHFAALFQNNVRNLLLDPLEMIWPESEIEA